MKILAFVAALLFSSIASAAFNLQQFAEARAVVKPVLVGEGGSGSATILTPRLALSSAHLVRPGMPLRIRINGQDVPVTPRFVDPKNDLALFEGDFTCPCATVSDRDASIDEEIVIVGYPLGNAIKFRQFATEGRAQGIDEDGDGWTSGHAVPGNSGGGVFIIGADGHVKLAGVMKGIANGGPLRIFPNMSYAVGLTVIKAFLQRSGAF